MPPTTTETAELKRIGETFQAHPPDRPEPDGQRSTGPLENGARDHRRLMSTGRAHPKPSLGGPRLGPFAGGAHELLPPAEPRQMLAARLLGRETRFELPERARVVLHSLNHYRLGLLESRTYPHATYYY